MAGQKPTAISFFSGAGGMDAGFNSAGFDVRLALEIDEACCETLRRNLTNTLVMNADINKISAAEILSLSRLKVGEIDCIFGGPPCQSFSLAGKREGLNDERGLLVFRFIELVRQLRPKTFVMENVKGMVNWQGGHVMLQLARLFNEPLDSGERYDVTSSVLNAANFGVPQSRERVFIVGTRLETKFEFPSPTHSRQHDLLKGGLKKHTTVGEALASLPRAEGPSETALRVSKTIGGRIERHGY